MHLNVHVNVDDLELDWIQTRDQSPWGVWDGAVFAGCGVIYNRLGSLPVEAGGRATKPPAALRHMVACVVGACIERRQKTTAAWRGVRT